jgi:prolyl-tRNA synthetase
MLRILRLVRDELDSAGAQEFYLPPAHAAAPGQDRPADFGAIARNEIRSYKDLPQIWYRVQTKPRAAVSLKQRPLKPLHSVDFEIWSLDAGPEGLESNVRLHRDLFGRIFSRCGLATSIAKAHIGGPSVAVAEDHVVRTAAGEEEIVACACGYAASAEFAISKLPPVVDIPAMGAPLEVHTPGQKTIAEVAEFLKVPPSHQIKSLVYMVDDQPCLLLVRGDHQLSESKAVSATGALRARPACQEEIRAVFGADAGSLGPVGAGNMPIYADMELRDRTNLTCGANRNDYHLQGVAPDVHFKPVWTSLRMVERGEICVRCGNPLGHFPAAKVGSLHVSTPSHARRMGWVILAADGKQTPVHVGTYRIFPDRIMHSVVELHHDEDGIIWPTAIAPFQVTLIPIQYKDELKAAADRLYDDLRTAGIDVLIDDRPERPGVKFKDADLIGVPFRLVLGPEKLKQGSVELFRRATREKSVIDLHAAIPLLREESGVRSQESE